MADRKTEYEPRRLHAPGFSARFFTAVHRVMQGEKARKKGRSVTSLENEKTMAENGVMTLPQCANADGNLPSCAPLANPYVPFQQTGPELYQAPCALIRGTLFPGLDLPYGGQENTQEKLATASVELQQMGFALQELALYLDTHAQDDEAAQLFNQYVEMYQQAIEQYQQGNGPLTLMDAAAGGTYDWLSGPWPWEYGKER